MARYKTEDGKILNTDLAAQSWTEATKSNGSNMISCATGNQWVHQTLYKSSKGGYWIETESQWQNSVPSGRRISLGEAAVWLTMNDYNIPKELEAELESMEE